MKAPGAALAILLLLSSTPAHLPLLPSQSAQAQAGSFCQVPCPWWNEDPCNGPLEATGSTCWHMRVPVLLEPRIVDRVNGGLVELGGQRIKNYPATVELDFTKAIREARTSGHPNDLGWPKDPQGRLSSFSFDRQSVRVVEYDHLKGCMLVRDRVGGNLRCFQPGDRQDDALLPSTFTPGLWENPLGLDPTFDAERNAVGTLQWVVRGEFGGPRLFFVYFDILQNGAKPLPKYKPEDSGVLDGLHFIRWGTDILGFAPGTQVSGAGVLYAQALFDNTTIAIFKYVAQVEPPEMVRQVVNALGNAQNSQAGPCPGEAPGTVCLDVPQGERFFFRVLANKPVVVGMRSLRSDLGPTWYPSKDAGLAGQEFLFRALGTTQGTNAPLFLVSPTGPANVQMSGLDDANGFSGTVDGARGVPVAADNRYTITSSRPILALQSSVNSAFGYNLVSFEGAPVGSHLVGFTNRDLTLLNFGDKEATLLLGCKLGCAEAPLENVRLPNVTEPDAALYTNGCSCGTYGEVWRFDMKEEAPLWGKSGEQGIIPLGGRHGMHFRVSLQPEHDATSEAPLSQTDPAERRLILMGLYNNTKVTVRNATGGKPLSTALNLHQWLDRTLDGQPIIPYGDYIIESSKPVAAYLYGPGTTNIDPPLSTYYVAKVEPPLATLGPGEFHGFAVGWAEKVKTAAVGPGERVRIKLTVVNLGRGIGGKPLTDDIAVQRQVLNPPNATLNNTALDVDLSSVLELQVPSFEARDITLSATVPAQAATGTVYQVNVTALSKGNPSFADVARVVITVQIRYEFTMRFLETNSTSIQKIIKPDTATCMDIEVKNTGTGDVSVRLQMSPTRKSPAAVGFVPLLLPLVQGACDPGSLAPLVDDDGQSTAPVVLRRGEARLLTLYVRAPADTRPLPLELEVQGTAAEDASVRQQLSAVVFTNVEAKVKLTALNDTRTILPGGNATYDMLIENVGDVETPVEYGITGLLPLGWSLDFLDAPAVLRGRGSVDALGKPLDSGRFVVNLTAAQDAPVAMVVPVNVVATSAIIIDTGETAKAFRQSDSAKITAVVGNNFTLEQPEALPVTINPGEPFTLAFELRNIANGNFTLRVLQGALPRNWTLSIDQPRNASKLEVGDRLQVRISVTPEVATKAGVYDVGLAFLTQDDFTQGAQFRNVSVLVRSTVEFRVEPDVPEVVLAPGGQREIPLRVVNTGNLPVQLRLSAAPPPGYQATFTAGSKAELKPGEATRLVLLLRAPDQAAEQPQALRIVGTDDTSNKQRDFRVQVSTARMDLVVTLASLATRDPQVGEPAAVVAQLQNRGTIPANQVSVVLLVNGRGVRNETLRTLPPGEPRAITIPWTVDEVPREIVVVVDADDKFAESDESNNQYRIDLAKGLPGFGSALAAAALALAVGLAGKRRGPPRGGGRRDG